VYCIYPSEIDIQPIVHGGGHENGYRSGTENVPGIVGIGKACEIIKKEINEDIEKMKTCRDRLIEGILNNIDNCYLNGPRKNRLPNNANFTFENVNGEALVLQLDSRCNIGASTGSACSVKDNEPSRVLTALGLDEEAANSSLRLSLSKFTKKKEIDKTIEVLPEVVSNLRDMRGF